MMNLFRRLHSLALLLILASPGIGGVAMPVLHPCPVDLPWLAGGGTETGPHGGSHGSPVTDHEGHGDHHGSSLGQGSGTEGHQDGGGHLCSCMGSCCPGAIAESPAPVPGLVAGIENHGSPVLGGAPRVPGSDHLSLLPPSTAPPLI